MKLGLDSGMQSLCWTIDEGSDVWESEVRFSDTQA